MVADEDSVETRAQEREECSLLGILPATQQILTKYYLLVQYGPEMKDCGINVSEISTRQ